MNYTVKTLLLSISFENDRIIEANPRFDIVYGGGNHQRFALVMCGGSAVGKYIVGTLCGMLTIGIMQVLSGFMYKDDVRPTAGSVVIVALY